MFVVFRQERTASSVNSVVSLKGLRVVPTSARYPVTLGPVHPAPRCFVNAATVR